MKLHWTKVAFLAVVIAAGTAGSVSAQKGNGAPKGKKVFSWNVIGTPNDYEGGCGGGHRVFVERGARSAHIVFEDHNTGWAIAECDATGGDTAVIHSDSLGTLDVYARILGKPNGTLYACAMTVVDFEAGETLCLLGTIDLKREGGRSRFRIQPDSLFGADLENIIWLVDTNADFRIAQFRVYQSQ